MSYLIKKKAGMLTCGIKKKKVRTLIFQRIENVRIKLMPSTILLEEDRLTSPRC